MRRCSSKSRAFSIAAVSAAFLAVMFVRVMMQAQRLAVASPLHDAAAAVHPHPAAALGAQAVVALEERRRATQDILAAPARLASRSSGWIFAVQASSRLSMTSRASYPSIAWQPGLEVILPERTS